MSSEYVECPRCGTKLPVGTKFCPNCGLRLDSKKMEKESIFEQEEEKKLNFVKEEIKVAQKQAQNKWPENCPNCGFPLSEGEKYCPNCGFNVEVWVRRRAGEKLETVAYYTTPKKFFSFEGYNLEGVTPAAVMYLIWAFWNLLMAVLVYLGQTKLFLPFSDPTLQIVFLVFIGIALILAAFGLMQVNSILYLLGIIVLTISIPFGIIQISASLNLPLEASSTGTHQMENLLMGFLAIMISTIGLIQTLRIRKYFFGE